jgi:hypothetical protein
VPDLRGTLRLLASSFWSIARNWAKAESRVAKAVLIGAVPPIMVKTPKNDNYIDRVAGQCVNALTPKWSTRLAAFDVYIWDQCYSMEQTLRIE